MTSAAHEGWLERSETAESLILNIGGRWNMRCAQHFEQELRQLKPSGTQTLHINFSGIESLDTAGAWLLLRLAQRLHQDETEVAFDELQSAHADSHALTRNALSLFN